MGWKKPLIEPIYGAEETTDWIQTTAAYFVMNSKKERTCLWSKLFLGNSIEILVSQKQTGWIYFQPLVNYVSLDRLLKHALVSHLVSQVSKFNARGKLVN